MIETTVVRTGRSQDCILQCLSLCSSTSFTLNFSLDKNETFAEIEIKVLPEEHLQQYLPKSPKFLAKAFQNYGGRGGRKKRKIENLLWKTLRTILREHVHSANYGQILAVTFLMWALLKIYRETITVAAKHLLETGQGPPIHFTQAIEAVKCSLVSLLIWAKVTQFL